MSDYFDYSTGRLVAGQTARAADVNTTFDELDTGLDKLPTEAELKGILTSYGTDGGSANTYTVTMTYTKTSYTDGMEIMFKAAATNTGASTLNVDSVGAKSIKRQDGTALVAGDITINKFVLVKYNSTSDEFELMGTLGAAAGTGTMSAQNASSVSITGGTLDGVVISGLNVSSLPTRTTSNTTGQTISSSYSELRNVDAETLAVGDVLLISAYIVGIKGATGGNTWLELSKKSGTATINMQGYTTVETYQNFDASGTVVLNMTVVAYPTVAGTAVMQLRGKSEGSNTTSAGATLSIIKLKIQ